MNIFELKNLNKQYQTGDQIVHALDDVTINFESGKITTILGPSGSGKTTMLNMISGLDKVDSGQIIFDGKIDIAKYNDKEITKYRRENVGFVFQNYNLIQNLTVKENVQIGEDLSKNPLDVDEIINLVGLSGSQDKMIYQLSGGQQQRVAIARVLVKNPKVIFCDEPTGALDEENGKNILALLQDLNKKFNTTIIMVTHNPSIGTMSHTVMKFKDGKIIETKKNIRIKKAHDIVWA